VRERRVVTVFLRRIEDGAVLLGRRSDAVRTYPGRWAGISGSVEGNPYQQALVELAEEAGVTASDVTLVGAAEPLTVLDRDLDTEWLVYPFLFDLLRQEVLRLDWEHVEFRWVAPADVATFDTVPGLVAALHAVDEGGPRRGDA
jgi:8-oxo-dGTP pyrophosphatase MutT (NUDIX family)